MTVSAIQLHRSPVRQNLFLLSILALVVSAFVSVAHAAPLSDDHKRAFAAMQEDPAPAELIRNSHYWVSNENVHDVYREHIQNTGGILIGVGADQVYLLAGWSRPEILIPMDFDGSIRDIHFAYGAAFLASPDIATFRSYWAADAEEKMRTALKAHFDEARAARALAAWKDGSQRTLRRFGRIEQRYRANRIPTFLTDSGTYNAMRALWQEGRVYPLRGDVTGDKAMVSIARAAKSAEQTVRVIYLSNVEQYVEYSPSFRRNFLDLPMDEQSWLLRTRPMKSLGLTEEDCEYHYNMQRGLNFQQWLKVNRVPDGRTLLLRNLERTNRQGLSEIRKEAPVSASAPDIAPTPR